MSCRPFPAPLTFSLWALAALGPVAPARALGQSRYAIAPLAHPALCVEAPDGAPEDGAHLQLAPCAPDARQAWQFVEQAVFLSSAACVAVDGGVDRDGTGLRVRPCDPSDGNQHFVREGELLRWVGHERCVDVARGRMAPGTRLEIWRCSARNDNQRFAALAAGAAAGELPDGDADRPRAAPTARSGPHAPSSKTYAVPVRRGRDPADRLQSAGTYLGVRHVSLASFLKRHPVLKPLRQDLIDAARSVTPPLPPTLLAALAMEASGGNSAVAGGLMQLTRPSPCTVDAYGDVHDERASLLAAAHCLHDLLVAADGDLEAALHAYDGDATPDFVDGVRARLLGGAPSAGEP